MIDTKKAEKYLADVRKKLGGDKWIKEAEAAQVTYETVGGISRRYALDCYINGIAVKDCVKVLQDKFPGGK